MTKDLLLAITVILIVGSHTYGQSNHFPGSGNVGIGIGTGSSAPLHVLGETRIQGQIRLQSPDGNDGGIIETTGDPTSSNGIKFRSNRGNGYFSFWTNNSTYAERLRIANNGNVGIGVSSPTHKLEVNGTIKAKEVNVTTSGWADYVFNPDYKLTPLSELETFIQKNGHLPNIPTETEVMKTGVNLAEMNVKLLEKVEELTLYVLELKKKNDDQDELISKLLKLASDEE